MIGVKNAVITGATKGIGKAIAEKLANEGLDLYVCSRSEDDLLQLKEDLKQRYPSINVYTKAVDLSKKEEVHAFVDFVKGLCSQLDVLVNNAGLYLPGKISEEDDGVLESQMEVNVYSVYYLTKGLLPLMIPHQNGYIFNMCSIASFMSYPNSGSYSISKFALLGFSKVLRSELMDKGIKVSAIMPGATWSNSWTGADLPWERLMKPEDVAESIIGALHMSDSAVMEEIILRPQLGDL